MTGPVVVVGDALLDRDVDGIVERLSPDAPVPVVDDAVERARPGGAALAAALLAADGRPVALVAAVGDDAAGDELRRLLAERGVEVHGLALHGATPEKVRVMAQGRPLVRVDRGGRQAAPVGAPDDGVRRALASASAVLVADYGRGVSSEPALRALLGSVRAPVVWDPHPRGATPVPGARLATPNRAEASLFTPEVAGARSGDALAVVTARARLLAERWRAVGVAVTLGAQGALLAEGDGPPLVVPAPPASGDPCGAGDRFAATAAALLAEGALPSEAVTAAVVAASAFVAAGGAVAFGATAPVQATPPGTPAEDVVARVRAAGGTVVATGGCFDLLHAGHVSLLTAARRLGDCLVVCLNSDRSVRALKGPDRPLVPAADRAAVLLALGCVDAVAVFDEGTPEAVLARLRPDVFVKGGDYAGVQLPEAALLAGWGGQAVVVPYLEGRSTTRLLEEVTARVRT